MVDLGALFALRLRTPRLELRLPTRGELAELQDVAAAGVHPAEEMPFEVPWTDFEQNEDWVIGFHEQVREAWRPDAWNLELGVWAEGKLVGAQGMAARNFAQERRIATGSWLGQPFQGRGYGTETRAAVLSLAFDGLGAEVARSGALDRNIASMKASWKLGYRAVGGGWKSPRGEPVWHTDFELRREEWHPPFRVAIEGLEPALPLFGATAGGH
jgi:RimJ/RimL family protein N-acetyltransferase